MIGESLEVDESLQREEVGEGWDKVIEKDRWEDEAGKRKRKKMRKKIVEKGL